MSKAKSATIPNTMPIYPKTAVITTLSTTISFIIDHGFAVEKVACFFKQIGGFAEIIGAGAAADGFFGGNVADVLLRFTQVADACEGFDRLIQFSIAVVFQGVAIRDISVGIFISGKAIE